MGARGYVVRGKHKGEHAAISDVDGTRSGDKAPNPFATINDAVTRVVWLQPFGWSDVAIFRVHDDGREERLPSYEEALTELKRLKQREADIVEACERVADGGQYRADIVSAIQRIRRERDEARAALGADPLAALEAAERRLLEAGGWTVAGRDVYGAERWTHPTWKGGAESLSTALTIERRRLAAKGGA